ncbi:MAG: MBL fold metallo-hydrolase [Planctomycetota bacterium]
MSRGLGVALACLPLVGCSSVDSFEADGTTVHRIAYPLTNAYVIESPRGDAIIVDPGPPGRGEMLLERCDRLGIERSEIHAIVLTHSHRDHAGAAPEVRALTGAPILVHGLDAFELRVGSGGPVRPNGLLPGLARPFVARPYEPFEPDELLGGESSLERFGIAGSILPTPGHTDGSVSIVLDNGYVLVGDLVAGALIEPTRMATAFFEGVSGDTGDRSASIAQLFDLDGTLWFPGHGGPLDPGAESSRVWFERSVSEPAHFRPHGQ